MTLLLLTTLESIHSDLITVFMSLAHNNRTVELTELSWSVALAPDGLQVSAAPSGASSCSLWFLLSATTIGFSFTTTANTLSRFALEQQFY